MLTANLTRDVEIRYSQAGKAIGNFGLASNKIWKDQNGQSQEKAMFIDATCFGRTAEVANQYLRKGSKIAIQGEIDFQQWTAQDGSKRSKHVILIDKLEMLSSTNGNNGGQNNARQGNNGGQGGYEQNNQHSNGYTHGGGQGYDPNQASQQNKPPSKPTIPEIDVSDEEIPF